MKRIATGVSPVDIVHVEAFRVALDGLLHGRPEGKQIVNGLVGLQQPVVFDVFQLLDGGLNVLLTEEVFAALVTNAVYLLELTAQNVLQQDVGCAPLPLAEGFCRCQKLKPQADQKLQRRELTR